MRGSPSFSSRTRCRWSTGTPPTSCASHQRAQERLGHLGDASQAALEAWFSHREFWPGAVFVAINKGGIGVGEEGMSGQAMLYIARRRDAQASVAAFSPQYLRRTFVGALLDTGADLSTVQQLAGHAQIQTTARYGSPR